MSDPGKTHKLLERIKLARREMRIDAGLPLTEEELELERQKRAVAALDD